MNLRIWAASALIFVVAGHVQADDRSTAGALYFHNMVKSSCGFNMTSESAKRAAKALGMASPFDEPLVSATFAICGEVKKGNKSKTIEVRVRDQRKVMRKITVEKAGYFATQQW